MENIKHLFEAAPATLVNTFQLQNSKGETGFVIPEYQRLYDWTKADISRLFSDMLTGFARLNSPKDSELVDYTYLGSIILVKERTSEKNFKGESYSVVDGQQRLTTLALIACSLSLQLKRYKSTLDASIVKNVDDLEWLHSEIEERMNVLEYCAVGSQNVGPKKSYPFPRIIRAAGVKTGDERGSSKHTSLYYSSVALFLEAFSDHIEDVSTDSGTTSEFSISKIEESTLKDNVETTKLLANFEIICKAIEDINLLDLYEDKDFEPLEMESITHRKCKRLFEKLENSIEGQARQDKALGRVKRNTHIEDLIRLLLFSSYFCNNVVVIVVIAYQESAAFDIFDSLNTTGQPLTALETLKPRTVSFENGRKNNTFQGSPSHDAQRRIETYVDEKYRETPAKQSVTKELIISFALYLKGKKLATDLRSQRDFLAQEYKAAVSQKDPASAHRFVNEIADICQFRYTYFTEEGISENANVIHSRTTTSDVQLLSSFVLGMKTSIAIPALFRYWNLKDDKLSDEDTFVSALKVVVAFILIRRAATGGTASIEGDFRSLMTTGDIANFKYGNCVGVSYNRKELTISELKGAFREYLNRAIKNFSKDTWIDLVVQNPIYEHSRALTRFMILMAAHRTKRCNRVPGTWIVDGVRASKNEYNFRTYDTWMSDKYCTVEHIAPNRMPTSGWDASLHKDNIRQTLGNLTLLPQKENAAIGNQSWEKKKIFYKAVTAGTDADLQKHRNDAKAKGVKFTTAVDKLLDDNDRLPLLEPLGDVDDWNSDVVETRSKNIAELCWNTAWEKWLN